MRFTLHQMLCVAGSVVACAAQSLYAEFTVDQIVPENAVVVVGVGNVEKSLERFRATPFYALMQEAELGEHREHFDEAMMRELNGFLANMDRMGDDFPRPTGAMGMGMYPVIDPETGMPTPAVIAFAEFGEHAETVMELLHKGITRAADHGMIESDSFEVLGRTVHTLDFGAVIEMIEGEMDMDPFAMMMLPDISRLLDGFQQVFILREADGFLLGSDLGSLTESIHRIDRGEPGIGARDEYRLIGERLGTNDAFGMILTRDLVHMVSGADQTGMVMMVAPMAAGILGDVRGLGMSMRLDHPDAVLEQKFALSMRGRKVGLSRLFDVTSVREEPPRFAGPATMMYMSTNFAFDQVADVIREIIRTNPLLQMAAGNEFDQVEGTLREVTATLGPRIYFNSSLIQPLALEDAPVIIAIDCRDEAGFDEFFSRFGPDFGLERREFMGQRIYSPNDEMQLGDDLDMLGMMMGLDMPSISLGIGSGFVFIGTTAGVEDALRRMVQPEAPPTLAGNRQFNRATALLPDRPLLTWSYLDIAEMLAIAQEGLDAASETKQQEMMARMRRDYPEIAAEMEANMAEKDAPASGPRLEELIRRHIGPCVSYIEPTEDGFVGATYVLTAEPVEP